MAGWAALTKPAQTNILSSLLVIVTYLPLMKVAEDPE
jgi:hypothetical protein